MRRFLPTLAGGATVIVVLVLVSGSASGGVVGPVVLLVPLAGAVAWWVSRRGERHEQPWARSAPVAFVAAAEHAPSTTGAVALALGRVESRELVASGSFGAALGLAGLAIVLFGFVWSADFGGDLPRFMQLLALLVHPLVGLTILAAFRARSRARRDDVEELFASCPTTQATRTIAHLTTGWVAAVAALATAALLLLGVTSEASVVFGRITGREIAALVAVAVLGCGGVALGVLLARLAPWSLVPVVVVVAIGFASTRLATNGEVASDPVRQLSTWLGDTDLDLRFTAPHWLAHLVWLIALTAVVATLAVLCDLRRPWVSGAVVASVLFAGISGWAATRPMAADDAQRIAAVLADPVAAQDCAYVGPVTVCAFDGERGLRDRYLEEVTPVILAVPADFAPVLVHHAADLHRTDLAPEVLALLPDDDVATGVLPIDMTGVGSAYDGARAWVGLAATGIAQAFRPGTPVEVRGQARGALALWLATRGADQQTTRDLTSYAPHVDPGDVGHRPWPDPCFAGTAPVIWAATDVAAAQALTELPEATVAAVVDEQWERFVDPATSTDELLAAVGLEPLGEPSGRTRIETC